MAVLLPTRGPLTAGRTAVFYEWEDVDATVDVESAWLSVPFASKIAVFSLENANLTAGGSFRVQVAPNSADVGDVVSLVLADVAGQASQSMGDTSFPPSGQTFYPVTAGDNSVPTGEVFVLPPTMPVRWNIFTPFPAGSLHILKFVFMKA